MQRLKICHCIDDLAACGAQQVVRHLVTHLDTGRFDPIVYTFGDGPLREAIGHEGVRVRVLQRYVPKLDLGLVRKLRKALQRDAVDVLHMHLFGACLHGTLASAGVARIRRIVTLHADRPDNRLQDLGWPNVLKAAHAVVAVSRHTRESIEGRYGAVGPKANVILNGIDLSAFAVTRTKHQAREAFGLPATRPLVGSIGRLAPGKGHKVLLTAFAELRRSLPDAQLIIAGEGELRGPLTETRDQLGLNGSVRFLGTRSEVPDLLAAMDVFALSSLWEGLPLVLLEAMAAGTPVVATAVGGIPEVMKDGEEGLLVTADNPRELAQAIQRVLLDSSVAVELSARALAKVQGNYDARRMVREHEALYGSFTSNQ